MPAGGLACFITMIVTVYRKLGREIKPFLWIKQRCNTWSQKKDPIFRNGDWIFFYLLPELYKKVCPGK